MKLHFQFVRAQWTCNNLGNGKHTCVLLFDIKKAFDTVNHKIMLQKLDKYMALKEIIINSSFKVICWTDFSLCA